MYIKVSVVAGARREEVKEVGLNRYEVFVKEKAENNQANRRIIVLMAEKYGLSASKIRIISGHHKPGKMLSVEND